MKVKVKSNNGNMLSLFRSKYENKWWEFPSVLITLYLVNKYS